MSLSSNLLDYWRQSSGIARYARAPVAPDPIADIRRQVEERDEAWLGFVERAVFAVPGHPYRRMFELAGCEFGDLCREARRDGVEVLLGRLYDQGVYLSVDEFKGRAPIVRAGQEIPSPAGAFQNRLDHGWLKTQTGGSTGRPAPVTHGAGALVLRDQVTALTVREFDLARRARLAVRPILPSSIGLVIGLAFGRFGVPIEHWYATGGAVRDSMHYRALTRLLVQVGRANGIPAPAPDYLLPGTSRRPRSGSPVGGQRVRRPSSRPL